MLESIESGEWLAQVFAPFLSSLRNAPSVPHHRFQLESYREVLLFFLSSSFRHSHFSQPQPKIDPHPLKHVCQLPRK